MYLMSEVTQYRGEMDPHQLASLRPGGVLHYDCRTARAKETKLPPQLRVVQWNIERGVQFDRIVETLRALRADVLVLQELDINCRRSNYRNVPRELAEALQMQIYFVCEFEELDAADRPLEHAVGPLSSANKRNEDALSVSCPSTRIRQRGKDNQNEREATHQQGHGRHFHGNAILSASATLTDAYVFPHSSGIDWEQEGWKLHEPRHGFRSVLRCCIRSNTRTTPLLPDLYVYCCHFEVFCGVLARVRQLLDVFRDMNSILEEEHAEKQEKPSLGKKHRSNPAFIVGGDFNTMADGIVRFSSRYGMGRMRLLSVGEKEACWLQRKVLSRHMHCVTRGCCPFSYTFPHYILTLLYDRVCNSDVVWRWLYGFSAEEVSLTDNRSLCLYDAGDKALSITLDNPVYHGFVRGKLDWLLLSNMWILSPRSREGDDATAIHALQGCGSITAETASYLQNKEEVPELLPRDGYVLFNEHFDASDHKGLLLQVQQHVGVPRDTYPMYGALYTTSWMHMSFFALTRAIPLAAMVWLGYKVFPQKAPGMI